jgi:hypothetical protein
MVLTGIAAKTVKKFPRYLQHTHFSLCDGIIPVCLGIHEQKHFAKNIPLPHHKKHIPLSGRKVFCNHHGSIQNKKQVLWCLSLAKHITAILIRAFYRFGTPEHLLNLIFADITKQVNLITILYIFNHTIIFPTRALDIRQLC